MAELTAERLAQRALDLGLVDDRQVQQVWGSLGSQEIEGRQFLQLCVRQGILTNYQVERLVNNERTGFFYGDFKVQYLVGAGTFARVYRAVHRYEERVVAVKVLRSRYSDSPTTSRQFLDEGEVGKALRHPNIVPIYEVDSQGRQHFIAMEFVEGQNLREFIKIRKKFDPIQATKIILDACSGLAYAAERGVYHRDLKLSNVLVSSVGRAKLVDFGMAGVTEKLVEGQTGDVDAHSARTVDYSALERITRVERHDPRSDIYFLTAMYYHLLTGESPLLETRDRSKRMSRQRFTDVKPIQTHDADIPVAVTLVVNKGMSLDVDKRYQSMADMRAEMKNLLHRLETGDTSEEHVAQNAAINRPAGVVDAQQKYTVLIVESSAQMQDIFRKGFKNAGYRVLVTSDPKRAVSRMLEDDQKSIHFAIFNAQLLGVKAVKAFNALVEDNRTRDLPAILLLDENQKRWAKECETAPHRLVIGMPVTMKGLRVVMAKILDRSNGDDESSDDESENSLSADI